MENNIILKGSGLYKRYADLEVLKGIDMQVKAAEIVSIVGASGAGKSTLLHILGTLDRADKGSLQIAGEEVLNRNEKDLAAFRNQQIGFVFQFHNLLPEFTAFENICIPGYIGKRSTKEVAERAQHLMELLGVASRQHHKPAELSGGEQQRVSVARALINAPAIVLADEPSGNLDSINARQLHELFFRLREQTGQTFVIVTHNHELAEMADRKVEITDGKIAS